MPSILSQNKTRMNFLDEEQIKQITAYMFLPDSPVKADATIVLGQTLWQRPFQKAIEIYKAGMSGKLVFTGGYNPKLGGCEALEMKNAWEKLGYPLDDLLIDSEATNTRENMVNAKHLLQVAGLYKAGMAINLISINYHMRRAVQTLRQVFDRSEIQLGVVNYPSKYCEPHTWRQNAEGVRLIQLEMAKINAYGLNRLGFTRHN